MAKPGTNEAELAVVRRAYAKHVAFTAGVADPRIEAALAGLRREAFLGPGPWPIVLWGRPELGYQMTPDDDPVYLYQDVVVGILPEKGLNNGQPSFVTFLIGLGRPQEGDHAVHIGAGTGYYTAVISQLVGQTGRVTAIEWEPSLAAQAAVNLSAFPNVRVVQGDGAALPLEPADIIYVNAGAARPAGTWLDALKEGGRMVLPLTVSCNTEDGHAMTKGAIFLIERTTDGYLASWKSGTGIYPCIGARDAASEAALAAAFKKGGAEKVTRLYRGESIDEERCWVRGPDWALGYS